MELVSAVLGTCRSWPSSTGGRCSPFASKPCEPLACQLRSLLLHRSASGEWGKEKKKKKGIRRPDEGGRIVTNDHSINWIERIKLKKKKRECKFSGAKRILSIEMLTFLRWIDRVCVCVRKLERLKRAACCWLVEDSLESNDGVGFLVPPRVATIVRGEKLNWRTGLLWWIIYTIKCTSRVLAITAASASFTPWSPNPGTTGWWEAVSQKFF